MNITYQLTLNEYQEAATFHYKTGKRPLLVAVFVGMATFMMLIGTDFSNTQQVINNILMTFFALAFYILFTRMITAWQAKSIYKKSPILSNEATLHISGKGIQQDKKNNAKTLPWDLFTKWKENEKYFLIYTNSHQFNVIPKRAINEAQQEELVGYLEKYIR
jgi:hypothetical protein